MTLPVIYFAGTTPGDFAVADGSAPNLSGQTGGFRSDWVSVGIQAWNSVLDGSAQPAMTPQMSLPTQFWVHDQIFIQASQAGGSIFKLFDSSGVGRIIVWADGSNIVSIYKRTAAGANTLLVAGGSLAGGQNEYNLYVNYSTSGQIILRGPNGVVIAEFSGDVTTDGATEITQVGFGSNFPHGDWNSACIFSECIVSDSDTRGAGYRQASLTGTGTSTYDVGALGDISTGVLNDTSFVTSLSADEHVLDGLSFTTPSGGWNAWNIAAITQSMRILVGTGGGPAHAASLLNVSGVTYTGTAIAAPHAYFDNNVQIRAINPATSTAWTSSDLSSLQIGVQTAA